MTVAKITRIHSKRNERMASPGCDQEWNCRFYALRASQNKVRRTRSRFVSARETTSLSSGSSGPDPDILFVERMQGIILLSKSLRKLASDMTPTNGNSGNGNNGNSVPRPRAEWLAQRKRQ